MPFTSRRIQFAFTVSFPHHFPRHHHRPRQLPGGAGRAVAENPVTRSAAQLYQFWSKIFAVNFGMGVVSGLVMAYQFGTNWSGFSQFAGSITGPLLTYEVADRLLPRSRLSWRHAVRLESRRAAALHFFATCMVALGTLYFHLLDPRLQQLDAHAPGLRLS